jgi:hypothetical protein
MLQVRWSSFCDASLVLIAVLLTHYARALIPPRRVLWSALIVCIGISAYQMTVDSIIRIRGFHSLRSELIKSIGTRDIAISLRLANGGRPMIVVGEPSLAPALFAYGRIGSVTSLYWEAAMGIHAAADILSTRDEAAAEKSVRELGVTHFVLDASPETVLGSSWTALASRDPAIYQLSLAWKLAKPEPAPPAWLQLESEQTFLGRDRPTRIYRVLPAAAGS